MILRTRGDGSKILHTTREYSERNKGVVKRSRALFPPNVNWGKGGIRQKVLEYFVRGGVASHHAVN